VRGPWERRGGRGCGLEITKVRGEGTSPVWEITWGPAPSGQGLAKCESFASLLTGTSHVLLIVAVAANLTQDVAQVQYHKLLTYVPWPSHDRFERERPENFIYELKVNLPRTVSW
jgi:hypothetical protein